jgi:hypothetical protein
MRVARSGLRERIFGAKNIYFHIQYFRDGVGFGFISLPLLDTHPFRVARSVYDTMRWAYGDDT